MNSAISEHPYYKALLEGKAYASLSRHDKTQLSIKSEIASLIRKYARHKTSLLEIGGCRGYQTVIYSDQLDNPGQVMLYDWQDFREAAIKDRVQFAQVDLETQTFPNTDETFDVIVCNQVLEHIKNIFTPLSQMWRSLKPEGYLVLSVPNLSALHNCILLSLGQQPTTLNLSGSHVRGYAIKSMTQFLQMNGHFKLIETRGIGLHPLTSASLPGLLKTYCHTPVWILQKQVTGLPLWDEIRASNFTTTNFFHDDLLEKQTIS